MRVHLERDRLRRRIFARYEYTSLKFRCVLRNQIVGVVPINVKGLVVVGRIRNRCVITGRSRSVSRFFKISRIQFRELSSVGKIPGIFCSSW